MPDRSITALLLGAFSIAAVHALIPSHWLAFAVVGRARGWTRSWTVTVALMAGAGHVALTIALGLLVAAAGKSLQAAIPHEAESLASGVLLIALGLYFVASGIRGGGHSHAPTECAEKGHDHAHGHGHSASHFLERVGENPTVFGVLILGMTLSPCLDLLSLYVAAASFSWTVILGVSLIMAVTTLALMLGLVWVTVTGLQFLKLGWLDRYEGPVIGLLLMALGIARLIH